MGSHPKNKGISCCNKIIEFGLIFLVIYTPLTFGAVRVPSYSLMQFVIFILSLSWAVKLRLCKTSAHVNPNPPLNRLQIEEQSSIRNSTNYPIRKPNSKEKLFYIPLVLFFLLGLFQLVPLSPKTIKFLSPKTYELYSLTIPGFDGRRQSKSETEASSTDYSPGERESGTTSHQYRCLSLTPYATKTILLGFLTYIIVFLLIIHNFTFCHKASSYLKHDIPHSSKKSYGNSTSEREKLTFLIPINRLIHVVVFTGFFIAGLGMLQKMSQTTKIYWLFDTPPAASPFGTFVNRNNFAGYVNMIIPIALSFFISNQEFLYKHNLSLRTLFVNLRKILISFELWLSKYSLYLLAILTMVSSLILSTSRGGILSFLCSLFVFFIVYIIGSRKEKNSSIKIVIPIILISILGLSLLWSNPNPLLKRISKMEDFGKFIEVANRVHAYRASWKMVMDFPWVGAGLGTFPNLYLKYRDRALEKMIYDKAHSDYLQILVETGLVGLIIVVSFPILYFCSIIARYRREGRFSIRLVAAGVIAGISSMLFHSTIAFNIQIPANALLFAILLGFAYVLLPDDCDKPKDRLLVTP